MHRARQARAGCAAAPAEQGHRGGIPGVQNSRENCRGTPLPERPVSWDAGAIPCCRRVEQNRPGTHLSTFKYKAFISYSWSDKRWGAWLHRALETYRAPGSATAGSVAVRAPSLQPIFKDREEEAVGASIGASIEAALGSSEFLIVLCSPRSAASKWVNREIAWFKTHRDPKKVLCVIVDGEPMASLTPGCEALECFPKTLIYEIDQDLQPTQISGDVPLAADARASGDGKRGAKLKLAAAMLGVGLDELVRRDDRRRTRTRRFVYAGLGSLSVLLGGLTVYAFAQRDAAIEATRDAEFQRNEAQDLVEFMLTDLRQRLDALGRLDVLESVGERLEASYSRQDPAKLDPAALGRQARVLTLLGEVDATRGELDAALARYQEAATKTAELLQRDPEDQQRIFDHAQAVYWVGDIAWKRGDAALAREAWIRYRDHGARLVALDPGKDEWQTELGYGHRNLGVLSLEEGDAADAIDAFSNALDISRRLARRHPDDAGAQIILADDYAWLANAQLRFGAFADAERALAEEAAVNASLLALDGANDSALQRQAVNGRVTARLAVWTGAPERALAILQDLGGMHRARLANESENRFWLDLYCRLHIDTANVNLVLDHVEVARAHADEALGIGRRLVAIDASVFDWSVDCLGSALHSAARAAIEAGAFDVASSHLAEAEALAGRGESKFGRQMDQRQFVIRTAILRARLAERSGDPASARRLATDSIPMFEPIIRRSGVENRTVFLEAYLLAGELAKARALADQLVELGYRHAEFEQLRGRLSSRSGNRRDPVAGSRGAMVLQ